MGGVVRPLPPSNLHLVQSLQIHSNHAPPKYDLVMALKPSLSLKLGQQLRMTPQLQQAIKLLQLSTLDLQQEIQDALDSNLMLEEYDEQTSPLLKKPSSQTTASPDDMPTDEGELPINEQHDNDSDEPNLDSAREAEEGAIADDLQQSESSVDDLSEAGEQDAVDLIESSSLQEDLAVDSNWDDVFEPISMGSGAPVSDDYDPMESRTQSQTWRSIFSPNWNYLTSANATLYRLAYS